MGKVIAVANQKGGVGKTTTVVNLSSYLSYFGENVLIIDSDPQANTTSGLGIEKKGVKESIYKVLLERLSIEEVIVKASDWVEIIPANINLIGAEVELVNLLFRELRLKKALEKIKEIYDYILIDCPPSLGLLTINALVAADTVLVPIQCEYYALEGLGQLMETIQVIKKNLNSALEMEGVLLTMHNARANLSAQVVEEVRKFFGEKVYQTIIPRNVRLSEAPGFGKPIIAYSSDSKGARAYRKLALEFLTKNDKYIEDNFDFIREEDYA